MSENVSLHLFGPNVTRADAVEAGRMFIGVLDAVAENMGLPTGLCSCDEVQIACDSCDARRPWDDEGHGWVRTADGQDFCPECIVTEPRA